MENRIPTFPSARIFFIEDDPECIESLRRSVQPMAGEWEMLFFSDPAQGLAALRGEPSAVAVAGWAMREMDGLAVCRELRKEIAGNLGIGRYAILLSGPRGADDQVAALDGGADDFISRPFDPRILLARIRVGLRLLAMQAHLRDSNKRLLEMAATDPLTGAFNRRQGMNILLGEIARVQRGQQDLSIILVDLDKFKAINDTRGHIAGDMVLCRVVDVLKAISRPYDAVVRWGGDELLVACPGSGEAHVREIAERFRRAIAALRIDFKGEACISLTASLGAVTLIAGNGADIERLVGMADGSLYEIKRRGGNGAAFISCGCPSGATQAGA